MMTKRQITRQTAIFEDNCWRRSVKTIFEDDLWRQFVKTICEDDFEVNFWRWVYDRSFANFWSCICTCCQLPQYRCQQMYLLRQIHLFASSTNHDSDQSWQWHGQQRKILKESSQNKEKKRKIRKLEYKTIHSFFVVLPPQSLECHAALATNAAFPGYVGHGSNATHATSGMHGANAAYAGYAYMPPMQPTLQPCQQSQPMGQMVPVAQPYLSMSPPTQVIFYPVSNSQVAPDSQQGHQSIQASSTAASSKTKKLRSNSSKTKSPKRSRSRSRGRRRHKHRTRSKSRERRRTRTKSKSRKGPRGHSKTKPKQQRRPETPESPPKRSAWISASQRCRSQPGHLGTLG